MATIADIIKYEGDNNTFVWKHPCEDFNTTTQLIVHESQEAIFFLNGLVRSGQTHFGNSEYSVTASDHKHSCQWGDSFPL